jgi:hypothetical protein
MNKNLKNKYDLELFKAKMEASRDPEIFNLLDNLILERVERYRILKIEPFELKYINENAQKEMIKEISKDVIMNISPSLFTRIGLVYNEDLIGRLITEKVSIHTIEIVSENNSGLRDDKV